jgi:hypothetical protein
LPERFGDSRFVVSRFVGFAVFAVFAVFAGALRAVFFALELDFFGAFAVRRDAVLVLRFAALRAGARRPAGFFAAFFFFFFALAGFFRAVFFLANAILLCRLRRKPNHTIRVLSRGGDDRVVIEPVPGGLEIRIQPLAGRRSWRWRVGILGALVASAALAGSIRLAGAWENGLKRGEFSDLPLPALVLLSLSIVGAAPFALAGLAALAFAEERILVSSEEIRVDTTAWERTQTLRIARADLECWRETRLPLPPWWTWAVTRLAARANGRLHPLAGAAGPKEKRRVGLALAKATGKPLIGDFGRRLD